MRRAWFASLGRGYLPPLGWTFLMMALAQIAGGTGLGRLVPLVCARSVEQHQRGAGEPLPLHSYCRRCLVVFVLGTAATFLWWLRADQAK